MENANRDDQIVASEVFAPSLSGEYINRYNALLDKLICVLPANRVSIIKKEISLLSNAEDSLDLLKYIAALNVLIDLSQQGWTFDINDNKLVLKMEIDKLSDEEKNLIIARYYENMSQKEVGDNLGMYQVEVSRQEKKILKKLRDNIAA